MPFGLKNAPSIFQRCVNDILHEYIGKFAYVYIDDVFILTNTSYTEADSFLNCFIEMALLKKNL